MVAGGAGECCGIGGEAREGARAAGQWDEGKAERGAAAEDGSERK